MQPKQTTQNTEQPTPVVTPLGVGIQISNVNQSLWQYIKKRRLIEFIIGIFLTIGWEAFAVIIFVKVLKLNKNTNSTGNNNGFGYLFAIPLVVFLVWYYRLKKKFEDAFLEEFAAANGYSFDKNGIVNEAYGSIFRLKGRQSVSDVVSGKYNNSDIRLFLYDLTVGYGRYQRTFPNTVLELDLHGQLPNLLMISKHYKELNLASVFDVKNVISLEGDFNNYFTLYGPKGNEVEALEVFSPDTMALMEDESKQYSVEFAGNRIYIYCGGEVSNSENLVQIFTLAKKIIDKIGPLASRLQSDTSIIATPVNLVKSRKTNPFVAKVGLAFIFLSVGLGVVITIAAVTAGDRDQQADSNQSNTTSSESAPPIESVPTVTATDIANATSVSNQFISDLSQDNAQAAFLLTSPHWQEKFTNQTAMTDYQEFNITGYSGSITNKATGIETGGTKWVTLVYTYTNQSNVYYVRIGTEDLNNQWCVDLLQGNPNPISP